MKKLLVLVFLFVALGSCKKDPSTPAPEKKPDTVVVKPTVLDVKVNALPDMVDYGSPSRISVYTNLKATSTPITIKVNGVVVKTGSASFDSTVIYETGELRDSITYEVVYPDGVKTGTIKVREIEQSLKYLFDGKWSLRKIKGRMMNSGDSWNEAEVTESCMLDNYRVYGINKILKSFDGPNQCPYNVDLNMFYRYYYKSDGNLYFLHGEVQEVKVVSITATEFTMYRIDPSANGAFAEVFETYLNIAQ